MEEGYFVDSDFEELLYSEILLDKQVSNEPKIEEAVTLEYKGKIIDDDTFEEVHNSFLSRIYENAPEHVPRSVPSKNAISISWDSSEEDKNTFNLTPECVEELMQYEQDEEFKKQCPTVWNKIFGDI